MDSLDQLKSLLPSIVRALPDFIVLTVGLFISISRYQKFPKVSRISIIAFSVLLIINVVGIFLPLLTLLMFEATKNANTVGWIAFAFSAIISIINASAFGLLIYAMWVERDIRADHD